MTKKMSFEEVESLVLKYKEGDFEAAERLVSAYHGYIQKLANVLVKGKPFNIHDRTQRSFIRLFMKESKTSKYIDGYMKSPVVAEHIINTVNGVRNSLNIYDEWEIKNEFILLFLDMAKKHDKSGLFGGYINDYFTLRAATIIVRMLKKEQQNELSKVVLFSDSGAVDDIYDLESENYTKVLNLGDTEFDENWINGYTCGDIFKPLTTYERRLLKWHYEWKIYNGGKIDLPTDIKKERKERFKVTDEEIAGMLGCSRKTVVLKRKEAVECLELLSVKQNKIR